MLVSLLRECYKMPTMKTRPASEAANTALICNKLIILDNNYSSVYSRVQQLHSSSKTVSESVRLSVPASMAEGTKPRTD